jgi:hypothetical protein
MAEAAWGTGIPNLTPAGNCRATSQHLAHSSSGVARSWVLAGVKVAAQRTGIWLAATRENQAASQNAGAPSLRCWLRWVRSAKLLFRAPAIALPDLAGGTWEMTPSRCIQLGAAAGICSVATVRRGNRSFFSYLYAGSKPAILTLRALGWPLRSPKSSLRCGMEA